MLLLFVQKILGHKAVTELLMIISDSLDHKLDFTKYVKPCSSDPPGQGIYKATFQLCHQQYIRETSLLLEMHKGHHKSSPDSTISEHQHIFDCFSWKFLSHSHYSNEWKILESVMIRERKLELNKNLGVDPYAFIWENFIYPFIDYLLWYFGLLLYFCFSGHTIACKCCFKTVKDCVLIIKTHSTMHLYI